MSRAEYSIAAVVQGGICYSSKHIRMEGRNWKENKTPAGTGILRTSRGNSPRPIPLFLCFHGDGRSPHRGPCVWQRTNSFLNRGNKRTPKGIACRTGCALSLQEFLHRPRLLTKLHKDESFQLYLQAPPEQGGYRTQQSQGSFTFCLGREKTHRASHVE